MKTRFDDKCWITGNGEIIQISDMGTDHILNCLKMFIRKPDRTISMLIDDIENHPDTCPFQPWGNGLNDVVNKSINNITSMTKAELDEDSDVVCTECGSTAKEEFWNSRVDD